MAKIKFAKICVYKIYNMLAPSYLCNFQKVSDIHTYNSRSNMAYVMPRVKIQGGNTFMFNGAKLWNELTVNIKSADNKDSFKSKCKVFFFAKVSIKEDSEFTRSSTV